MKDSQCEITCCKPNCGDWSVWGSSVGYRVGAVTIIENCVRGTAEASDMRASVRKVDITAIGIALTPAFVLLAVELAVEDQHLCSCSSPCSKLSYLQADSR